MRSLVYILIVGAFVSISLSGNAQCKNFAKRVCRLELKPYVHDGNYNAAILTEGEDAELFKTFYAGQEYRISVCGSESLSRVEFQVMDVERRILYTNASDNYAPSWDFNVEATQQLIIMVKVHDNPYSSDSDMPESGCVAIMFGLKLD
ncbi:MAG: hypothetical protein ACLFNU_05785 [Bacteroidales bacterium]